MHYLKKVSNGIVIILTGLLHTQFAFSSGGFGQQLKGFSESYFYKISEGLNEFPAQVGLTNFENFSAFWFLYFGLFLIPLGLLLHSYERNQKRIPQSFTITYLLFVLVGSYMVPNSGITVFMLPHALFMLIQGFIKSRKIKFVTRL